MQKFHCIATTDLCCLLQASMKETLRSYEEDTTSLDWQITQVTTAGRGLVDTFSVTREGCDERWSVKEIDRRMHPSDLVWESATFVQSPWTDGLTGKY
jgi:hypothetical protein